MLLLPTLVSAVGIKAGSGGGSGGADMFRFLNAKKRPCDCEIRRWRDHFILMRSFVFRAKREDTLDAATLYDEASRLTILEDAVIPIVDVLIDEQMLSQFEQYKEVSTSLSQQYQ